MAVLGHKTPNMARYYVEQANKKKLADQGAEAKRAARVKALCDRLFESAVQR